MKRSAMKRSAMKRKPPRNGHVPAEVRQAVLDRSNFECEAAMPGICTGRAEDLHHRQRRNASKNPHSVLNCIYICRACHHHITFTSPAEGKTRGLIISAFASDIAERPFYARGAWWLLSEDGSKQIVSRAPLGEGWTGE